MCIRDSYDITKHIETNKHTNFRTKLEVVVLYCIEVKVIVKQWKHSCHLQFIKLYVNTVLFKNDIKKTYRANPKI